MSDSIDALVEQEKRLRKALRRREAPMELALSTQLISRLGSPSFGTSSWMVLVEVAQVWLASLLGIALGGLGELADARAVTLVLALCVPLVISLVRGLSAREWASELTEGVRRGSPDRVRAPLSFKSTTRDYRDASEPEHAKRARLEAAVSDLEQEAARLDNAAARTHAFEKALLQTDSGGLLSTLPIPVPAVLLLAVVGGLVVRLARPEIDRSLVGMSAAALGLLFLFSMIMHRARSMRAEIEAGVMEVIHDRKHGAALQARVVESESETETEPETETETETPFADRPRSKEVL